MADRRFPTNVEELDRYITEVMNENGFNQEDRSADGVPYSESVDGTMTMPLVRTDGEGNLIGYQQSPVSAIGVEALRGALINAMGRYYNTEKVTIGEKSYEEHFYITFDRPLPSDAIPVFVRRMGHRRSYYYKKGRPVKITTGWKRYAYFQRKDGRNVPIDPNSYATNINTSDYSQTTVLKLVATTKEGMYEIFGRDVETGETMTVRQMLSKYFIFEPGGAGGIYFTTYLNSGKKLIEYKRDDPQNPTLTDYYSWKNLGIAMCDKKGNYLSTIAPLKIWISTENIRSASDIHDNIKLYFG